MPRAAPRAGADARKRTRSGRVLRDRFIVTCEHGGNRIPARYRSLFTGAGALLASHRGFDPGALQLARELAAALRAPLVSASISRLLVDLNRSIGHPRLHWDPVRAMTPSDRELIIDECYRPYRRAVESQVARDAASGRVIHLSSHSFTPVLDGKPRHADIGLLYDPSRDGEVALCAAWKQALHDCVPALRVRRNYPYAGIGDGLTSYLRSRYSAQRYVGIELEVNQKHVFEGGREWQRLRRAILASLHIALARFPASRARSSGRSAVSGDARLLPTSS